MNTIDPAKTGPDLLGSRQGLPDGLQVLLAEIPREAWEAHPNFGELVRFWLERHVMFRALSEQMRQETEQALDGRIEHRAYAARLGRVGGFFLNQLHGHHQIEDHHYFPHLVSLDPRLEGGFAILDSDHHVLDARLNAFAETANTALGAIGAGSGARDAIAAFHGGLTDLDALLDRHLEDEEDLIVPVILKSGFQGM